MTVDRIDRIIDATYFSIHRFADRQGRLEGRKLGGIVDQGFRFRTPDGKRIQLSIPDLDLSIQERAEIARGLIEKRLRRKRLDIRFG